MVRSGPDKQKLLFFVDLAVRFLVPKQRARQSGALTETKQGTKTCFFLILIQSENLEKRKEMLQVSLA